MTKKQKAARIITQLKKFFPQTSTALSYKNTFQLLVAVILSAQATDKKVNEVTPILFAKYKTAKDFEKLTQEKLEKYIKSVGLFRSKAKNILKTAKIINGKYKGKIPDTIAELIRLPGVGRKTANVVLGIVYGKSEGIAVDTHVGRLSRLFGLSNSSSPEKIEKDLMGIVPREDWRDFTFRMIDYGRKFCPASCKHANCPLREFIVKKS